MEGHSDHPHGGTDSSQAQMKRQGFRSSSTAPTLDLPSQSLQQPNLTSRVPPGADSLQRSRRQSSRWNVQVGLDQVDQATIATAKAGAAATAAAAASAQSSARSAVVATAQSSARPAAAAAAATTLSSARSAPVATMQSSARSATTSEAAKEKGGNDKRLSTGNVTKSRAAKSSARTQRKKGKGPKSYRKTRASTSESSGSSDSSDSSNSSGSGSSSFDDSDSSDSSDSSRESVSRSGTSSDRSRSFSSRAKARRESAGGGRGGGSNGGRDRDRDRERSRRSSVSRDRERSRSRDSRSNRDRDGDRGRSSDRHNYYNSWERERGGSGGKGGRGSHDRGRENSRGGRGGRGGHASEYDRGFKQSSGGGKGASAHGSGKWNSRGRDGGYSDKDPRFNRSNSKDYMSSESFSRDRRGGSGGERDRSRSHERRGDRSSYRQDTPGRDGNHDVGRARRKGSDASNGREDRRRSDGGGSTRYADTPPGRRSASRPRGDSSPPHSISAPRSGNLSPGSTRRTPQKSNGTGSGRNNGGSDGATRERDLRGDSSPLARNALSSAYEHVPMPTASLEFHHSIGGDQDDLFPNLEDHLSDPVMRGADAHSQGTSPVRPSISVASPVAADTTSVDVTADKVSSPSASGLSNPTTSSIVSTSLQSKPSQASMSRKTNESIPKKGGSNSPDYSAGVPVRTCSDNAHSDASGAAIAKPSTKSSADTVGGSALDQGGLDESRTGPTTPSLALSLQHSESSAPEAIKPTPKEQAVLVEAPPISKPVSFSPALSEGTPLNSMTASKNAAKGREEERFEEVSVVSGGVSEGATKDANSSPAIAKGVLQAGPASGSASGIVGEGSLLPSSSSFSSSSRDRNDTCSSPGNGAADSTMPSSTTVRIDGMHPGAESINGNKELMGTEVAGETGRRQSRASEVDDPMTTGRMGRVAASQEGKEDKREEAKGGRQTDVEGEVAGGAIIQEDDEDVNEDEGDDEDEREEEGEEEEEQGKDTPTESARKQGPIWFKEGTHVIFRCRPDENAGRPRPFAVELKDVIGRTVRFHSAISEGALHALCHVDCVVGSAMFCGRAEENSLGILTLTLQGLVKSLNFLQFIKWGMPPVRPKPSS